MIDGFVVPFETLWLISILGLAWLSFLALHVIVLEKENQLVALNGHIKLFFMVLR